MASLPTDPPANPYQPPATAAPPVAASGARLFTAWQVAAITFFGSVVAGGMALAVDAARSGRRELAYLFGLGGIAVTFGLALLPDSVPMPVLNGLHAGLAAGAAGLARPLWERADSPQRISNWNAAGLSLAGMIVALTMVFSVSAVLHGTKSFMPPDIERVAGGEVWHWDDVTPSEARALGRELQRSGYFSEGNATVVFEREEGAVLLCFVVRDGAWDEADSREIFRRMATELDDSLYQEPLVVYMCSPDVERKKKIYG